MANVWSPARILILLTLSAVAYGAGAPRETAYSAVSVTHGRIVDVERVQLEQSHAAGTLLGGLVGVAASRNHSTGSQVGATLAGALLGNAIDRGIHPQATGTAFTVETGADQFVKIITHQNDIRVGDCVAVERGEHTNLRRVAGSLCNHPTLMEDPVIRGSVASEANECQAAKELLLAETDPSALELLIRKVKVLCDS